MIGMPNCSPKMPGFVIVKVPESNLVGLQLFAPRSLRQIGDSTGNTEEVLLFGLFDHRHDQAPFERNRDADVDVLVVANGVAFERCVHDGHPAQRGDHRTR